MQGSPFDRDARVFDFVSQYLTDLREGQARSLEHYLERFPGFDQAIAAEFRRLQGEPAAEQPDGSPGQPDPGSIDSFRLVRELGRGGQSVVYLAVDADLGRNVALKVIRGLPGGARVARLRREVEIVAQLDHPGICPVYQARLDGDRPYVAMRYVEGETLADILQRRCEASAVPPGVPCHPRGSMELGRLLAAIERTARALHAAHEAGVIHRDIKPANIMIDPEGAPVILDFGLARQAGGESPTLTRAGETFGTPAYMSPEQIQQPSGELDRRTDVYSLGVTLYECLTLRRPFEGDSRRALEQAICSAPVPDPTRLNRAIPGDLRVVLETALEKDRSRRYATALDFAEDLRRVRTYEPILAQPAGPLLRVRRWSQRHPVVAVSAMALALLLTVGFTGALVLLEAEREQRTHKDQAILELQAQNLAGLALSTVRDDPALALQMALACAQRSQGYHANNALLAAALACDLERSLMWPSSPPRSVALSPDGTLVATGHDDGQARLWSLERGEVVRTLSGHTGPVRQATFAPEGKRLVTASRDGTARVWDVLTGRCLAVLRGHTDWVRTARFTPGGQRVVTGSDDGTVRVFDPQSGACQRVLAGHPSPVTELVFARNGSLLLACCGKPIDRHLPSDHSAHLWDLGSGKRLAVLAAHSDVITAAAFSPSGEQIVTASADGTARLWDVGSATCLRVLAHPAKVHDVAFSPDGTRLLTVFDPGDVVRRPTSGAWLWDARTGQRTGSLEGHAGRAVRCAAFSPDGQRIATGAYDETARIWDAASGALIRTLTSPSQVYGLLWSPDGRRLITRTLSSVDIWCLIPREGLLALEGHTRAVLDACFGPLGRRVVTASLDGTAGVWDAGTGRRLVTLDGHEGPVAGACFSADGNQVLTCSDDGTARLWRAESGETLAVLRGHRSRVVLARFSPNGKLILTASRDGTARLWDARNGALRHVLDGHRAEILCMDFSPDSRWVATGAADRSARLWSTQTGAQVRVLDEWLEHTQDAALTRVFDVAFSADSHLLATAGEDVAVRLWRVADGTCLKVFRHIPTPGSVRFLDGNDTLAYTAQWGPSMGLLTSVHGLPRQVVMPRRDRLTSLDVHPDRTLVLTTSMDGTARLWQAGDLSAWAKLEGHHGPVLRGRFSADGTSVVTASQDGTARIWPTDPYALALRRKPRDLPEDLQQRYGL